VTGWILFAVLAALVLVREAVGYALAVRRVRRYRRERAQIVEGLSARVGVDLALRVCNQAGFVASAEKTDDGERIRIYVQ